MRLFLLLVIFGLIGCSDGDYKFHTTGENNYNNITEDIFMNDVKECFSLTDEIYSEYMDQTRSITELNNQISANSCMIDKGWISYNNEFINIYK